MCFGKDDVRPLKTDMWAASTMWLRQNCTHSGKIDTEAFINSGIALRNLTVYEKENINEAL